MPGQRQDCCMLEKNSIGEWDSMTRSMRGNADYYNQPMIVGFFFKGLRAFLSKK